MDIFTKQRNLGRLIKVERKRQKISQDKLGAMIGIDGNSLGRIERGENYPSFPTFCNIVEALKLEPNYLLGAILQYDKKEINPIDFELQSNIQTLSDEAKKSLNDFIKNSRKNK